MKQAGLVLGLVTVGCLSREEALPPVPRPAIGEPQPACVAAPPSAPFAAPIERDLDLQACLPAGWKDGPLPIALTLVDGRVSDFRFRRPCSLREDDDVEVGALVRECIRASLATWSYPVTVCPGHPHVSHVFVSVSPAAGSSSRQAPGRVDAGC